MKKPCIQPTDFCIFQVKEKNKYPLPPQKSPDQWTVTFSVYNKNFSASTLVNSLISFLFLTVLLL